MATLKQIETFMASQPIAIAGVSRNPQKFGYAVFKELKLKGLNVIPVNPSAEDILGVKSFADIRSLPPEVGGVVIVTKKSQTASIVREAREKGIKNLWIQQYSDTPEALKELEGSDINAVTGECILMYHKPHGFHKFHRSIKKLFGRYPK